MGRGNEDSHLYALNSQTSEDKWRFKTEGPAWFSSPAIAGVAVYFGSWDGHFYAVDVRMGRGMWRSNSQGEIHTLPVISGGLANDGNLYIADTETGREKYGRDVTQADLDREFDSPQTPVSPSKISGTKTPRPSAEGRGANSRRGGDGGESGSPRN